MHTLSFLVARFVELHALHKFINHHLGVDPALVQLFASLLFLHTPEEPRVRAALT